MPKSVCQLACEEDLSYIRNIAEYEDELDNNRNGIKAECIFDTLDDFHFIENESVDPMHDIFHGICFYDFIAILNECIKSHNFSVYDLNDRINTFEFPKNLKKNSPPLFDHDFLKKDKISMSANEWRVFTLYFGLMIGDLIPKDSLGWKLYLNLRQIIDLVFEDNNDDYNDQNCELLKQKIKEHHEIYLLISTDKKLKPKYHILTHYYRLKLKYMSLKHFACNRFEMYHQLLKKDSINSPNRINLVHSLALKDQLRLSETLMNYDDHLLPNYVEGKSYSSDSADIKEKYRFRSKYPFSILNSFTVNEYFYDRGSIVLLKKNEYNEPIFGEIDYILSYIKNYFYV
jgi:hypothetical protein